MMKKSLLPLFILFFAFSSTLFSQMYVGTDTLYGNEWIDYSKTYYKIKVAKDSIHRIPTATLIAAGLDVSSINGDQFRLYRIGKEVPIFVSSGNGTLGTNDFIEFYGQKNRDEVDKHLFGDSEIQNLSPDYNLFNDTAAYFLTVSNVGQGLRYTPTVNDITSAPANEEYCWYEKKFQNRGFFMKRLEGPNITNSWFNGDGFGEPNEVNSTHYLSVPNLLTTGPNSSVRLRYFSNLGPHHQFVTINGELVKDTTYNNWGIFDNKFSVNNSTLSPNLIVKVEGTGDPTSDYHVITVLSVRYPRLFDFGNDNDAKFELEGNAATKRYFEINYINGANDAVLLDLTNNRRYLPVLDGATLKFNVIGSNNDTRFVVAGAGIVSINAMQTVQFKDYSNINANYIILTHTALMQGGRPDGSSAVEAYKNYRESAAGGNYKVTVVDINDLYEQFAYGIRFHPISIRNFAYYIKKNWDNPEYLYVIGKGLNYNTFRSSASQAANADKFFVPMYGTPAVDCFFLMDKDKISPQIMAIGRLAAVKSTEISDYLDKIIEFDEAIVNAPQTLEGKRWLKTALTTGGGATIGERNAIRDNLNNVANVLRNGKLGADVISLFKDSNDPVQTSNYTKLQELLKNGIFHWTFFGHSSPNILDFDTGSPNDFNNAPHYPIFMALGCDGGLCSQPSKGLGENFVLAPHAGVLNFIATSNYGYVDALGAFGTKYHELMGGNSYGESIGKIMQATVNDLYTNSSISLIAVLHQMILQGDPAVKLPSAPTPDFIIDQESVKVTPDPVAIGTTPYKLEFDVLNLGKNTGEPLAVKIQQKYPNSEIHLQKIDTIISPAFRTRYNFTLSANDELMSGFNRLLVDLDPENAINESPAAAEINNDYTDSNGDKGIQTYFYLDGVQTVFPIKYAIVNTPKVVLKGFIPYLKDVQRNIKFEMDTLETFASPFVIKHNLLTEGGLIEWKPEITLEDEKVYYWRIAKDTLINNKLVWLNSSFVYAKDSPTGWNQSNYGQYIDDEFYYLQGNETNRTLDFTTNGLYFLNRTTHIHSTDVTVPGINVGGSTLKGVWGDFRINFTISGRDGVILVLLNTTTGDIIKNPLGSRFNALSWPGTWSQHPYFQEASQNFFFFETKYDTSRQQLMNFLENEVPPGTAMNFLTINHYNAPIGYAPRSWALDSVAYGRNLFQVLEGFGAKEIRKIQDSVSAIPSVYGGILIKGDPDFEPVETIVDSVGGLSVIRADINTSWYRGNLLTSTIGPVKKWGKLIWEHNIKDAPDEIVRLRLFGVRENKLDTLLLEMNQAIEANIDNISSDLFPKLKLEYYSEDTLLNTATQLKKLRVLYEPIPEGSVNPAAYAQLLSDTVEQGRPIFASVAFQNISDTPMDSILVKFSIQNNGNPVVLLQKYKNLPVGDSIHTSINIPTIGLKGAQQLSIEVNPDKNQPELFDYNNFFTAPFFVKPDLRNPLLDVTFDGVHILDGDIISPKPMVVVSLKDENPYFLLDDTSMMTLTLVMPDGMTRKLYFNDPTIQFFKAQPDGKNHAKLEWSPTFTLDGVYQLRVNGKDAAGNLSSNLTYTINFEVITKSSISNLLNYPNPFSTSTCFMYTFTGLEQPSSFKIQIMTVSGRVVREITGSEFGEMKAGRHVSDICWDGKDEFGDQLANGVYLYRVVAKKADGSNFETFKIDQADGFFKNGLGKMVLIR
jgi:hypothetical protein